jgi:hypothetical protein
MQIHEALSANCCRTLAMTRHTFRLFSAKRGDWPAHTFFGVMPTLVELNLTHP